MNSEDREELKAMLIPLTQAVQNKIEPILLKLKSLDDEVSSAKADAAKGAEGIVMVPFYEQVKARIDLACMALYLPASTEALGDAAGQLVASVPPHMLERMGIDGR
jgi:hypothetical protein